MSGRNEVRPATSVPAPTTPPSAPPVCPPTACPAMEIEINDTPVTTDDLVELKCERPAHRSIVNCRIRATAVCATSSTVVLTNPDGRLRFPNPADTTTTVTVPGDGSWVSFQISGERGSNAIGDAVIEAHCNTATGALKATKPATVFWFDDLRVDITAGGNLTLTGGNYTVVGANTVDYSVQARIRPAGVDCAAPQVRDLRVGIMQNALAPQLGELTYANPAITWAPGTPRGTIVDVPTTLRETFSQTADANDSEALVAPLYDRPGQGTTLDANSLQPPIGCAHGRAATSHDNPSTPVPPSLVQPAVTAAGANVGTVRYGVNYTEASSFLTWLAIFNTTTSEVCALRERTWGLNVDSAAAAPQRATIGAADRAPTRNPITGAPFANDVQVQTPPTPVGAATTRFTKP